MSRAVDREQIVRLYIRICRDSSFRMGMIHAAHFVAELLGISAIEVWLALDFQNMERIANGTHPALQNPRFT